MNMNQASSSSKMLLDSEAMHEWAICTSAAVAADTFNVTNSSVATSAFVTADTVAGAETRAGALEIAEFLNSRAHINASEAADNTSEAAEAASDTASKTASDTTSEAVSEAASDAASKAASEVASAATNINEQATDNTKNDQDETETALIRRIVENQEKHYFSHWTKRPGPCSCNACVGVDSSIVESDSVEDIVQYFQKLHLNEELLDEARQKVQEICQAFQAKRCLLKKIRQLNRLKWDLLGRKYSFRQCCINYYIDTKLKTHKNPPLERKAGHFDGVFLCDACFVRFVSDKVAFYKLASNDMFLEQALSKTLSELAGGEMGMQAPFPSELARGEFSRANQAQIQADVNTHTNSRRFLLPDKNPPTPLPLLGLPISKHVSEESMLKEEEKEASSSFFTYKCLAAAAATVCVSATIVFAHKMFKLFK